MLQILSGLLSGISGLFGGSSSESFEKFTDSVTKAEGQDLSPELLTALESLFMGQIGESGHFSAANSAVADRLAQIQGKAQQPLFDTGKYVEGIIQQAGAIAGLDLESQTNGIAGSTGGSITGNSMLALLDNKLRNQTAANIAGISSEATKAGEEIRLAQDAAITQGISGLGEQLTNSLLGLIGATRGAYKKGISQTKEHTTGSTNSGGGGSGVGDFFSNFSSIFNQAKTGA